MSWTMLGQNTFSTDKTHGEVSELFVCISDGTNYNCITFSSLLDSSTGVPKISCSIFENAEMPASFPSDGVAVTAIASKGARKNKINVNIDPMTSKVDGNPVLDGA